MGVKIFYFYIFFCLLVNGQSKEIHGKLVSDDLNEILSLPIRNRTTQEYTVSDHRGHFKIPISVGDTLLISSLQYQDIRIEVSKDLFDKDTLEINLIEKIIELDEVMVSNFYLSGNLEHDIAVSKLPKTISNESLGLPVPDKPLVKLSPSELRLQYAKTGVINLFVNLVSGRLKKLKKEKEAEDLNELVFKYENAFSNDFFIKDLGLPKDYIFDFIYYCSEDLKFENHLNQKLELIEFFQNKVSEYKNLKMLNIHIPE